MTNKQKWILTSLTTLLLPAMPCHAADKAGYHLFNPTPAEQMRELSADRPDKTESPYTVDAGHFQLEMDIANYTYDSYKDNGENTRTRGWGITPVNLKMGLTNNTDIQFVVETYNLQTSSDKIAGTRDRADGFGDITIRVKHNFWGNDGGKTAFGIMPFIKLPTNQNDLGNDHVEGGIILPLAIELTDSMGLGLMTEVDFNHDATGDGYSPAFINTATIGFDLTEQLGAYVELFGEKGTDSGDRWIVTFDMGMTYSLTDNLMFDLGVNLGVTEAADDFNPFMGITYRY